VNDFGRMVALGAGAAASFLLVKEAIDSVMAFFRGWLFGRVLAWKQRTGGSLKVNGQEISIEMGRRLGIVPPIAPAPASPALPKVPGPWTFSKEWTAEDKLRVAVLVSAVIRDDIYAGRYSAPGRPNIQTIHEVAALPPELLEAYRPSIEAMAAEYESQFVHAGPATTSFG
jgi:hypothetical protein